jgi:TonB family protein
VRTCRGKSAARKAKARGKYVRVVSFGKAPPDDTRLTRAQLAKVLRGAALAVRMCAERAGKGKAARGTIRVQFRVRPDGTVNKARVRSSTIARGPVTRCAVGAVKKLRFPESGRGARVTYPFVL